MEQDTEKIINIQADNKKYFPIIIKLSPAKAKQTPMNPAILASQRR